jgi:serine/threonine protein kinase
MSLSAGARLGPYEILSTLGAGGMGEVYKARDTRLDRAVAIKVLPDAVAGDPDLRARFEREARAVAALDHPHICGIYDVGAIDGTHFLVMPHLDGETLAARLERGALPIDQALKIAKEIANALDKTHRQGMIHRDLKPANIMLTRAGSKLLDFGLAKLRAKEGPISMSGMTRLATLPPDTARGTILGTVQYMAPEQVEGREADTRSDIWAFGVLLYEMLTGTPPFPGDTPASVIGSILKDDPPRVSSQRPLASPALDHLVGVCLEKDPDERWQAIGDIRRHLEWLVAGDTATDSQSSWRTNWSTTSRLASLLAASLVGAAALWIVQSQKAPVTQTSDDPVAFTIEPPPGLSFAGAQASTPVPQFSLSPDGRHLAFVVADAQGQSSLWVRALDTTQSRRLTGTEGAIDPFWSPDGRHVGFITRGVLKATEVGADGSPQTFSKAPVDSRGGAWNAAGTILFYAGRPSALSRVTTAGGPVTELPLRDVEGMARWPEFLPDGQHVLFQVRNADPNRAGIYVTPLAGAGASARRLVGSDWAGHYGLGYVLFLDGSTLMAQPFDALRQEVSGTPLAVARGVGGSSTAYGAFSVSATATLAYAAGSSSQSELRWVDRTGRMKDLVAAKSDYTDLSLSPDQSRVAFSRVDPNSQAPDVWVLDLTRGTSTRITSERLVDASPIWSPDGERLVFRSNRSSTIGVELYLTTSSPGGPTELILGLQDVGSDTRSNIIPSYWSRDGRLVFSQATMNNGYGISMMAVGQKNPQTILETPYNEHQAAVSPNGKWMAYASDQSGHYEIYVQDFPTGKQHTVVSTKGGQQPQWRGDGRELYYVQTDGTLMQVSVRPGERFDASAPTALFKTEIPTILNPYRMDYVPAADGQRFLMKVPVKETPPAITIVLNWPALLKAETRR